MLEELLIPIVLCLTGIVVNVFIGRKRDKGLEKFRLWGLGIGKLVDETDEESREIDKYSR